MSSANYEKLCDHDNNDKVVLKILSDYNKEHRAEQWFSLITFTHKNIRNTLSKY